MSCVKDVMERVIWRHNTDDCGQDNVLRFCHTFGGVINWINSISPLWILKSSQRHPYFYIYEWNWSAATVAFYPEMALQ